MPERPKVFVSYGYRSDKLPDEPMSEADFGDKLFEYLSNRHDSLDLQFIRAREPQAGKLDYKVIGNLAMADAIFAVFTRRDRIADKDVWRPAPWVLGECCFLLGRYYDYGTEPGSYRPVIGIYETGIRLDDLCLVSVAGHELFALDRREWPLAEDRARKFHAYVKSLHRLLQGSGYAPKLFPDEHPSYKQKHLRKTIEVHCDGTVIFTNENIMIVVDPDLFYGERRGVITHHIWSEAIDHSPALPSFDDMVKTPTTDRSRVPCLTALLHPRGRTQTEKSELTLTCRTQEPREIAFDIAFGFRVSKGEVLHYTYSWTQPNAYGTSAQELQAAGAEFNKADVRSNHGRIDELECVLRIEKQATGPRAPNALASEPQFRFAHSNVQPLSFGDPHTKWTETRREPYFDEWVLGRRSFEGVLRVSWAPV